MMSRKKLYDGKAKTIFEGPEPGTVIQYFKDDATAFNAVKHAVIAGKGVLNNRISSHIMSKLEAIGVPTHFIKQINMREQLVREVEIVPIELVIRNVAAGSICKRLGIKEGTIFPQPIVEYFYKKDELGDPMISESHIVNFGWADPYELEEMVGLAYRVNDYLNGLFEGIGLRLIDFKLEFGRLWGEHGDLYIILADEISPDNCRLWDSKTGEKMDKDRFRQDLGDLVEGYQEIAKRLGLIPESVIMEDGGINEDALRDLSGIENEVGKQRRLRSVNKISSKNPRKG
ncbi:MAG: phosphoribosylaminoimidazolesuccinocarboxamide synthase [Alphaproteobacteria bacterium]|nr:phosphoribosylaminoimidazolesuccinocarboxamide synthase [Alphaproteobacteria bacterium]NCQ87491.1 phosphoribosylaminoimidazolesuccinocarboxamide synthase [Alphaproteobacteria bacterium]NCT06362.1 phosphoribosylaminoimidazolesuccinocarboxamide synthase [Alphaproteobacteria bacterium]